MLQDKDRAVNQNRRSSFRRRLLVRWTVRSRCTGHSLAPARRRSGITEPLKTQPAQHGAAHTGKERDCRGGAAFRAGDARFHLPARVGMFRFASLAVFWLVLESLLPEKQLLSGAEDELLPAIDAFQRPVGEFHGRPHQKSNIGPPGNRGRMPRCREIQRLQSALGLGTPAGLVKSESLMRPG
jgi:hypothetical protein